MKVTIGFCFLSRQFVQWCNTGGILSHNIFYIRLRSTEQCIIYVVIRPVWAKVDCRKTDFSEIEILHFCKSVSAIA